MSTKKYLLASCGTHVAVVGPDGLECKRYTPGIDAVSYADCAQLGDLECQRRNGVGVTFQLEEWREAAEFAGHTIRAHWQSNSIYFNEAKALADRDRFTAEGGEWRVVKQTREVLP